jgi:hypothetical protein
MNTIHGERITQTRPVLLTVVLATLFTALFIAPDARGAVVFTDRDIALAKTRIAKEPLKGYFDKMRTGDGGDGAALLYALTGERRYAEKARADVLEEMVYLKKYIPFMVNIWILRSPSQTVSALMSYDLTRASGVYTEADVRTIRETLSWTILHYRNKGRDHLGKGFLYQTDYIPEDMEDWVTANMNVHRLLAVGLYPLVFTDEPNAKEITRYASDYFERVLSLGSRPGGAWAENPRYMGGVLQELFLLASGLKNAGIHDYFADDRFKAMMGFYAKSIPAPEMQGPNRPMVLCGDDGSWWENPSAILGWAAARYAPNDPKSAGEWTWCWRTLGSSMTPESLLFVDPDIAPVRPSYGDCLPGMGYAILRDRFAEPDETFFFATFGPELGTSDRTMHLQPNHGDFSLIWRGFPVTLTNGCASYVWSRRMRDQTDFSHSVVTFDSAGSTLAIPENKYSGAAVEVNHGWDERLIRDLYPDGIMNYVSGSGFSYVSGQVRNWDIGLPAAFNVRHFLFLKPDALVIWDQVRSSYPLQWNFHIPAETVSASGNTIRLTNREGVNLSIDFIQNPRLEKQLDWTLDGPLDSIRAEWPMVLRCPYGKGMFIFNALDIARQVLDSNHEGAKKILENLLCAPARPKLIGLIETDGQTAKVLERIGLRYELLDYSALAGDLSRFDRIVIGQFAVLVRDRDMLDYRQKLWKYVENGGVCYWAYQYAWGWKPGDTSGPGYFPKTLMVGEGTSVLWGEGIELDRPVTFSSDKIWNTPNRIAPEDWNGWAVGRPDTFKVMPLYDIKPNTDRARNFPVYYSDAWEVLASAQKTYNIPVPPTRSRFGPYRWIKVHHKPSDDYLAVLRLSKEGVNGGKPSADILRGAENDIIIAQGNSYWRVLVGEHKEIRANLTLLRWNKDTLGRSGGKDIGSRLASIHPDEIMMADAEYASFEKLKFTFEHPATIRFDRRTWSGSFSTLDGGLLNLPCEAKKVFLDGIKIPFSVSFIGTQFFLPGGEYTFGLEKGLIRFVRTSNLARIEVVDKQGLPAAWVHVFRDLPGHRTVFQGATDSAGALTLRWTERGDQLLTLVRDKETMRASVKPGVWKIVLK